MQELVLASPTETFAVARGPALSNPGHELRSREALDLQPSNSGAAQGGGRSFMVCLRARNPQYKVLFPGGSFVGLEPQLDI
jgi:hypothetical protein